MDKQTHEVQVQAQGPDNSALTDHRTGGIVRQGHGHVFEFLGVIRGQARENQHGNHGYDGLHHGRADEDVHHHAIMMPIKPIIKNWAMPVRSFLVTIP